ncbi:sodium-coupled monocarboxylate transporter 2-like [Gigantopelta aegis]|uniref:sodium-coupled monocarboxylate transporter 2-like n=1 Tax=Gigantopelta aegis TaxID=1735272 RepID=UPI001B88CB93|nr:sodium-coupled monocarboxylate transporter 2-like [Gigantopelta aegis]
MKALVSNYMMIPRELCKSKKYRQHLNTEERKKYLGLRYESSVVRVLGTCVGMLQTLAYMSVCLLAPALALQAVVGMKMWLSVLVVGIVGTVYTSLGGIKSVVWTDTFQAVIMFIGMITLLVKGVFEVGGLKNMVEIANSHGRIIFDEAYFLNAPLLIVYGSILLCSGIVVFSYFYSNGCDPYEAGLIQNQNRVMPYFVMQVLAELPGVTGLYVSMLFSASLR